MSGLHPIADLIAKSHFDPQQTLAAPPFGSVGRGDTSRHPSHDQIMLHMGNDMALRMVQNDTEIVSGVVPRQR
jgi:hypothetical protein